MGTNSQVFASNAERGNYYKLSRQWGNAYRIYHNLPFLNVFNTKKLMNTKAVRSWFTDQGSNEPITLSIGDIDYQRLKKTSIDYTLCDKADRPLVCIEFDGIRDGFNVGTEYRHNGPPDPWRELITGLKLKVAHGSMFPYFVVGYDHFKDLAEDTQLTMVDGIIGEVLSSLDVKDRFSHGFDPHEIGWSQEDFDELRPDEQHELIQDWVIGVEVEAELKHNPISVRACELERQLPVQCACTWLSYPDADSAKSLQERVRLLESASLNGCRCFLHGGTKISDGKRTHSPCPFGPIDVTIWLPNFKSPGCSSMLGLVENLAKLVALERARKLIAEGV